LLVRLLQFYIDHPSVDCVKKAQISEQIADTDFKMIQGGNEELNLLHTLSFIARVINPSHG
jgi:hypothetical protein